MKKLTPRDDIKFLRIAQDEHALFTFKEHNRALKNANAFEMAMHIHPSAELLIVTSGEITVNMPEKGCEVIHAGEAAFFFPFQPHAYTRPENTEYFRINFSSSLSKSFFKSNENMIGIRAVFKPDADDISSFLEKLHDKKRPSLYKIKGFIYFILSDFLEQIPLSKKSVDYNILSRVIFYINEHKLEPSTVGDVAQAIGYNEKYLSRCINKSSNLNFSTLLAMLRIDDAKTMLVETDKTILEIAMDSGFGSERTFYRYFNELVGISPKTYRENNIRPRTVFDDVLV